MEKLQIKLAYDSQEELKVLFSEYTDILISGCTQITEYLGMQGYDEELKNIDKKYGMPYGRMFLAYWEDKIAGCVGLRKMDDERCEMKRLYVRPEFRGRYIGNELVEKIVDSAREIGYKEMYLDTLPFLKSAIKMYKGFGFYEIERYNDNPIDDSVYLKLDL